MVNHGYIFVDATGLDVSDSEVQNIPGLYSKLERAIETGKPIFITGMTNGDAPVSPASVACTLGAAATITMSGFTASVDSDDDVTPVEA